MEPGQWPKPIRFFLDSSVIYAASVSRGGAARALLALSELDLVRILVCPYILSEVEESLRWKNAAALEPFRLLNRGARWEILPDATLEEIQPWLSVVPDPHDAPILAVAVVARPERFITLDVKHWIEPPQIAQRTGLVIRTPWQVMQEIRRYLAEGFGQT